MTNKPLTISPLRQRMIEDMTLRKLSPKTQLAYIRAVVKLSDYLGHSPAKATAEELREFQLDMVNRGVSGITINATIVGLRFLFEKTLDRPDALSKMSSVPVPRKLPIILDRQEISRLLVAASHPKYQASLAVGYAAGLRINEIVALKVPDIDSQRMVLRVDQGKGKKDRYALLSPVLLEYLRTWWHFANNHHLMLNGGWLFPSTNPVNHLSSRQLSRAFHAELGIKGMDLLLIYWKMAWTYEPSKFCWATKNWKPQRFTLKLPLMFYTRSSARSIHYRRYLRINQHEPPCI